MARTARSPLVRRTWAQGSALAGRRTERGGKRKPSVRAWGLASTGNLPSRASPEDLLPLPQEEAGKLPGRGGLVETSPAPPGELLQEGGVGVGAQGEGAHFHPGGLGQVQDRFLGVGDEAVGEDQDRLPLPRYPLEEADRLPEGPRGPSPPPLRRGGGFPPPSWPGRSWASGEREPGGPRRRPPPPGGPRGRRFPPGPRPRPPPWRASLPPCSPRHPGRGPRPPPPGLRASGEAPRAKPYPSPRRRGPSGWR